MYVPRNVVVVLHVKISMSRNQYQMDKMGQISQILIISTVHLQVFSISIWSTPSSPYTVLV